MTNQPPVILQCDREAAEAVVGAANIVSHDGYYEIDVDAVTSLLARHREQETERERAIWETRVREIQSHAKMANGTIALKRDKAGGGRVKVATCMHHIERISNEVLATAIRKASR